MNKKEISYFENYSKRQPIGRPKYSNVHRAKRMRLKKIKWTSEKVFTPH